LKGVDILEGLKPEGRVLINYPEGKKLENLPSRFKYFIIDATSIAASHGIGSQTAPIVNTAIMGGFARMCDKVSLEAILESIREEAPVKEEENVAAAKEAYQRTVEATP
jgi:Pyruvate/2-oxoacid:ferredoxin oxidoreductase gamma subunit